MNSTEELLKYVVEEYKGIENSHEELLEKCAKIRKSLVIIIKQHLVNTEDIIVEIQNAEHQSSRTQTVLNFFHYLIDEFPHPVFVPSLEQCQSLSDNDAKSYMTVYSEFLYVLVSRLLQLLTYSELSTLHETANNTLLILLDLCKMQNPKIYQELLGKFIDLYVELHNVKTVSFVECNNTASMDIKLKTFSLTKPQHGDASEIVLSSLESLENWQIACSNLLQFHISDVVLMVFPKFSSLLSISLHQIIYCSFPLKIASAKLCSMLFSSGNRLSKQILENLMDCILPLIDITSLNNMKMRFEKSTASEMEIIDCHKALMQFLIDVFVLSYPKSALSSTSFARPNIHLSFGQLSLLAARIYSVISSEKNLNEATYNICNYVAVCGINFLSTDGISITSMFALTVFNITKTLCSISEHVLPLFSELMTNLFSFLCLYQAQASPFYSSGSAAHSGITIKQLSRKRSHELSSMNEASVQHENNIYFRLCSMIQTNCENHLSELCLLIQQFQLDNSLFERVLLQIKSGFVSLSLVFEPFLNSIVFLQDNKLCVNLLISSHEKINFASILGKYIEIFMVVLSSPNLAFPDCTINKCLVVYDVMVKLAKSFALWFHVMHCEMNFPITQENRKLLSVINITLSCIWLEDLPWKDLNADILSLSKSSVVIFCQRLKLSDLCLKTVSNVNNKQRCSIFQSCLTGLAYLPQAVTPMWKHSVLIQWSLACGLNEIEMIVISLLPIYCSKLKVSNILPVVEDVLTFVKNKANIVSHWQLMKLLVQLISPLAFTVVQNFTSFTSLLHKQSDDFVSVLIETKLISNSQGDFATIQSDFLKFVCEVVKMFSPCWNSREANMPQKDLSFICDALIDGLNNVLQCANKNEPVSQQLFKQFLMCFGSNAKVENFKPCFLDFDNLKWNDFLSGEMEDALMESISKKEESSVCNHAVLLGSILCVCGKQARYDTVVFQKCLHLLCKLFCSSSLKVRSMAFKKLEQFALSQESALQINKKMITRSVTDGLLENAQSHKFALQVFEDIASLFTTSLNNFLCSNMHILLPPLVLQQATSIGGGPNELVELFLNCLACSKSDLIKQNFKHIFCFAVTTESNYEKLFEYLENQTKFKKDSLIRMSHVSLIQHLLAHISVSSDKVCNALQYIHQVKSDAEVSLPVSELLKPHFLSVLIFFNSQLRLGSVTLNDKLQVYESLIRLLYLLDTGYITTVCVKIVNTLCLAQQVFVQASKVSICCKAWHALVRCVEDSCLGSLLSQVAAMLLPCLEDSPSEVAATLEFMIVEMHQHTRDNFAELYFLPDHKSLRKVKAHIEKELRLSKSSSSVMMMHILKQATKHLSHDSAEVRLCALEQVRRLLQSNQITLQRNILIAGGVSDLIQLLISALMTCCRDANLKIKLLSAKCLGEIGAVDPDKLNFAMTSNKPKSKPCGNFEDEDFTFDLFNCLVQAFLVAKPSHQDISAFAIQELLKIYNCRDGPKATSGRKLWRRFSEQIQAVLDPHLSSRYVLKKSEINIATLARPILRRKENMTFRDWIGTFCAVLMQMASSVIDESSVVRGVFDACAAVVPCNVEVAFFLLPPTVVEVLKSGSEYMDFIKEEIMAVLESTHLLQDSKKSIDASEDCGSFQRKNEQNRAGKEAYNVSALSSHLSLLSAQAVFSVLDHVTLWLQKTTAAHSAGALSRTKLAREKEQARKFLAMIPQKILATASLNCKDYKRALLHYEAFLRDQSSSQLEVESAAFLQRAFIEMNETDGVLGVVNVRGVEPSLETRLLVLESTGALQDAAACYERIVCHNPTDMFHYKGFFKCLINLGQLSEAVNLIDGTITNNPSWKNELTSYGIEACWRLGKWDLLEKKVESISSTEPKSWSVGIGRAILAIRDKNWTKLENVLDNLYRSQTDLLSVASMETNSFQRGYDHIVRLHTLSDLERFSNIVRGQSETTSLDDVMSLWQLRLQVVQPSFRAYDPVLSLGRVMLPLICDVTETPSDCDRYVGKLWLQTSKLARKCGLLQTAFGALLSAQRYALPGYCIEHAKWLWKKGESHQALLTLQRGFAEHYSCDSAATSGEQRLERAKVLLLEAKLMEESSSYDSNVVLRKYKEVVSYMGDWEDSHFYCGRYYDKLMTSMMGENKATAKSHHLYYIMNHYGRSLCFGTSHIYESLTKLLTLWMDYGETAAKLEKAGRPQSYEDVQRLAEVISDVRSRLPAYIFYAAFSQLTSRICHQHEPTYNQLKEILVSVILAFPQRALWSMIAISKSSFKQRANRCQEIFDRVRYKEPKLAPLITDFITITNRLLELCNKPVSNIQPLSIATHFKQLKKLVEGNNFSEIMLPLQKFMNVVLPQSKPNSEFGSQTAHNPFPEATAHIVGFDDSVEILSSLQRPKKISVRASDGQSYSFLCKPKDDLRKDARLTEFAAIVNKCLYRDAESGKRRLRIRTYAVIPLNEECGLIEWVENMKGLRHILLPIYKAKSLYCSGKQLKAWQLPVSAPLQKKLEAFRSKYLARHPPVFYEWFLTTFNDPSSWYNARMAYARSVAVMSMVGYILGLGDRHGENILFDSNNGEAMHVDFNCLFNKGLSLEVPEIVPFRLTHNMVDAMGPTKYEGFFRKACEVTMNVLREQREPLMSVLKTFIYDPLVEWSKKSRGSASSGEILSEKALSHVNDIDKRLRGIVGKNKGLPLSIEGHVHYLIQEATDEEKLCQMYIGWAPFM